MSKNNNNNVTNSQPQHSCLVIQSNNVSSWGGYTNLDINLNGYVIHEVTLQINTSAITGVTASGLFPCFCSAFKWFVNCNVTNQNNTIDLFDSQSNYLLNQLYTSYEDSIFINNASGAYNNATSRFAMGQTTSTWLVPSRIGIFNQLRSELLNVNHNIRVSLLMENLTNIINQSSLTGTPVSTINSVSLLLKVSKYDQQTVNNKLMQLQRNPLQQLYNSCAYQPSVINSGSTTAIITLSNFVNLNIQYLYFVIRLSSTLTKAEAMLFLNNITNYSVFSSSGENLTGSPISSQQSLFVYNRSTTIGCFTAIDSTYGNVFTIFHSVDPISTMTMSGSGIYGQRQYNGAESLQINFTSSLTANVNVDIYASVTSMLRQTPLGFTKIIEKYINRLIFKK